MYPCILKVFGICWGTQKFSGQDLQGAIERWIFTALKMMWYKDGKVKGFEADWDTAVLSVAKLCCCLPPNKQSMLYRFHPLHCTEPCDLLHSHVKIHLLWPCYSSYVSLLTHLMFSLFTKIKLYFQHAQQLLILGRTSQAQMNIYTSVYCQEHPLSSLTSKKKHIFERRSLMHLAMLPVGSCKNILW